MEDSKIRQMKGALLKCAEENKNKPTPTFNINVSRLCEDAELRIRELEEGYKTIKEKLQNKKWLPETSIDDAIDFIDKQLGEA